MKAFTLAASYQWSNKLVANGESKSEGAIRKIVESLKKRYAKNSTHKNGAKINFDFKRLRASAGKTILDSILNRIQNCNALIVDISSKNPNVYIELGLAIARSKHDAKFSLYLIREINSSTSVIDDLPSDLQGYFISGYIKEKNGIVYKENSGTGIRAKSSSRCLLYCCIC